MNPQRILSLILTVLALGLGGCSSQPPSTPQASDTAFTLETAMVEGGMAFVGVGGEIDGVNNPELVVRPGSRVKLTLVNGDGMPHDLLIPELNVHTSMVTAKGQSSEVVFEAGEVGELVYYCTVVGHREAGMEGRLIIKD